MWTELEKLFIETGLDYSRQGSYADANDYPPSFWTFWNFDTPDEGFYDNQANRAIWFWQVYYYSNDPSTLYSAMDDFISRAKAAGFVVEGRGNDISSDRTDYTGRMVTIKWIEHLAKD